MNVNEMAIDKRTALMMFWNAGFQQELQLIKANALLESLPKPTAGYWYAKDVSKAIQSFKGE